MPASVAMPAVRQNRSKLAPTCCQASSTIAAGKTPAGVVDLFMALLSFEDSAPRAYRLQVGNAYLTFSTSVGTSPRAWRDESRREAFRGRRAGRSYPDGFDETRLMPRVAYRLPNNIFRYVLSVSWRHQIALVSLTVFTFLLEIVPLEIQRRVVNNLVKERPFQLVIILCAAYASAVLVQGATKLGLNVYRSWV